MATEMENDEASFARASEEMERVGRDFMEMIALKNAAEKERDELKRHICENWRLDGMGCSICSLVVKNIPKAEWDAAISRMNWLISDAEKRLRASEEKAEKMMVALNKIKMIAEKASTFSIGADGELAEIIELSTTAPVPKPSETAGEGGKSNG